MLKLVEVVKIHSTDKPCMSLALKHLITQRQRAFHSGDLLLWRHLRTKVRDEIFKRKQSCYANKVRHLRTSDSRKRGDCVKQLFGNRKFSNMQIVKDGISVGGADLACLLNDHFVSVSADLPSLDTCSFPAYLPAPESVPTFTLPEMCSNLVKVCIFTSSGPDGIPNQIIKEFGYELADPVFRIFSASLTSGVVPTDWKFADTIPIPKAQPATCEDENGTIASTAYLSKILEDLFVKWMLRDIRHKIDPQQFGSLKGASTIFCLIDMHD